VRYFFEGEERQNELGRVLESWIGTPYRHWSGVKGLGCDCIHFVVRVYEEMGVPVKNSSGKFEIPRYNKDWHLHNEDELLLQGIVSQINVIYAPLNSPMSGDIILVRYGMAASHASIYHEGRLYQSITGAGVRKISYSDHQWNKRKRYNLRVIL